MVERVIVLRLSTKHINLWMRQLEMKRREIGELAALLRFDVVKTEIDKERNLEAWAKRSTHYFTKKVKRLLFEETDNTVWSGGEKEITEWCKRNKVYDEITEDEIEDIWKREDPDEDEPIRLNGKYVWEAAKRVCDYINAHEGIIHITTLGEYREVMKKMIKVIKEAHNVERKRRQTARKKKSEEASKRTQKAKSLISEIRRREINKEEIKIRIEEIFGNGSGQEIGNATTKEKIIGKNRGACKKGTTI